MADVDATFMQQILHIPELHRKQNIHHNRQADDFGRRVELLEWVAFCHSVKLGVSLAHFNQVFSDSAPQCNVNCCCAQYWSSDQRPILRRNAI